MKTGVKRGKRSVLALLLALALLAGLTPVAALADPAAPAASSNHGAEDYVEWSAPVASYLFPSGDGGVTRVEYTGGVIAVEDYDASFRLTNAGTVPMELELFGGFFAGQDCNFFIFGQENPGEDDAREVYRVVEYAKDWTRLGSASLYGANTTVPFDAGTARFAEADGMLYIRTCHEMYMTDDGVNHQSNLTMIVRERDMAVTSSLYRVWNPGGGYVSHSFNQFILADGAGNVVTLDHGDAYPRSAVLMRYEGLAGGEQLPDTVTYVDLVAFPDAAEEEKNYNFTGAGLGGLEETSSGYLAALSLDARDGSASSIRNVAVVGVGRDLEGAPELTWLTTGYAGTEAPGTRTASVPQLVKFSDDRFLVLWEVSERRTDWPYDAAVPTGTLCYAFVDGAGHPLGETYTADGGLSDCKPAVVDGRAVWYVTSGGVPVFYTVGADGAFSATRSASSFADLPLTHWASSDVERMVERGIITGYENGLFLPENPVTLAEFSKMLCVAFYEDAGGWTPWWWGYLEAVNAHGLLEGVGIQLEIDFERQSVYGDGGVNAALFRYDMAQMMYDLLIDRGAVLPDEAARDAAAAAIGDWSAVLAQYRAAVSVCYSLRLLSGYDDGLFRGGNTMTRAQACAVLRRLLNLLDE